MSVVAINQSDDNPANHPEFIRWMKTRRAALIQQAKGLEEQRRAVLAEVGELSRLLGLTETVKIGETDSVS